MEKRSRSPRAITRSRSAIWAHDSHYAIIGMAHIAGDYPLYYDAMNEKGLGMAGLNFVGNAAYADMKDGVENVAQFEFIPWILSQCATVSEAKEKLAVMNLVGTPFNPQLPAVALHWIIADKDEAIVVESMKDGLHVRDDPVGVLTNNPPFDMQMFHLNNYLSLSPRQPKEPLRAGCTAFHLQPRHGCPRTPGRSLLPVPLLRVWRLPVHTLSPVTARKKASASFSTF